jgi:hypothetical protein
MGRTKCITYIYICQISQFLAEFLAVLRLFFAAETCILKKDNIPFLHCLYRCGSCFTRYIVICNKVNFFPQFLGQPFSYRCQRFPFVGAVFHFAQMGAENYLAAIL